MARIFIDEHYVLFVLRWTIVFCVRSRLGNFTNTLRVLLPTLLVRALGPLATNSSVVCAILKYVPWFVSLISDVVGGMLLQRCFVLVALWLVSTGVRFFKVGRFSVGGRHTPDSWRVPRFRDKACSPVAAA